jgi:hypothetical protein
MAPRIISRAIPGLALACAATFATAANPLGSAVAGAPSLFVLAVVESRADTKEAGAVTQEREARQEAPAQARDHTRQAAAQAGQQARGGARDPADEPQLVQR